MTFESYAGDVSDIESIVISWEMDIYGGQLVIDNDAVDPATGSYEFGAKISLDSDNTDVTTVNSSFAPVFTSTEVVNSGTFSLDGNDSDGIGDYSSEGADGMAVSGESVSSSGGDTVFSGVYSQYVSGPGGSANRTFDIGIVTEQYLNVTSDGGTEYAITPVNASGIVTLVYNLKTETIPEPSSMAMLALGGLALLRRKR
ncbi:PEP-CTERM sorting domain-containing protein [Verrucomicrobiaceae bacterium R5-34]|uniref:PEP-CTERM sorting domain-containing protein n=1 Tax=Oceaniferula flava TaxID=2800421 RepID=A0AAE2SDW7_9BACT|nr:PEP-CTERM sorting domain-containing protein [Oceaniferula flavus]MBK1830152.1 PEP-CTERM sorting domain-containing protein [Verrucomicrobiaceae bacterium R5-34]MBK1854740.1 PEP-CTERM sorting domain-containing protein [Oceaniferula flavus]MBM1136046.1 PEP-CTERM sorting domain-containing protein [Oceaniferula flavus]